MIEISTEELKEILNKHNYTIIDIRSVDAYNGWKMNGEKRGGHIKGARSLPAKWSDYIDWMEIVRSKGILPEDKLVIYGYGIEKAEKVSSLFERAGYNRVFLYSKFIDEWSANSELPMERLERYSNLVHSQWLNDLMLNKNPEEFLGDNYVICHAHYRNISDYQKGHIPGSIPLDSLTLESPETWNRRSPKELEAALCKHGITKNSTVILYGRFSFPDNDDPFPGSSAGHLGAIRCAAIMLYAGVKDVKILNGGIQSCEDDGFELSNEENKPLAVDSFGSTIPVRPDIIIDIPYAKKLIESEKGDIVSVRSWNEWIGEVSGYNYIEKKGRIPGAVFGNCGSDAYHMENYRNLDHTIREYHEIESIWNEAGISRDKNLAFYCGTGWRGSEAFLNAWLMGWEKVSIFDGGWIEWSNDINNPIATGIPE